MSHVSRASPPHLKFLASSATVCSARKAPCAIYAKSTKGEGSRDAMRVDRERTQHTLAGSKAKRRPVHVRRMWRDRALFVGMSYGQRAHAHGRAPAPHYLSAAVAAAALSPRAQLAPDALLPSSPTLTTASNIF